MRKLIFIISLFFAVNCIAQVPSIGAFQIPGIKEQEDGGCVEYGYLYNWYVVTDARNICPVGWHIPTQTEAIAFGVHFETFPFSTAGGKLKETGLTYWDTPNTGATNEVGFNGRGGGVRGSDGVFTNLKLAGLFITDKYVSGAGVYVFQLNFNSSDLVVGWSTSRNQGYSIRLIKDDSTNTGSMTDNDGNIYPTVKIGDQVWMAQNLRTTKYRNGDPIPTVEDNTTWAGLTTGAKCAYDNNYSYVGCGETGN